MPIYVQKVVPFFFLLFILLNTPSASAQNEKMEEFAQRLLNSISAKDTAQYLSMQTPKEVMVAKIRETFASRYTAKQLDSLLAVMSDKMNQQFKMLYMAQFNQATSKVEELDIDFSQLKFDVLSLEGHVEKSGFALHAHIKDGLELHVMVLVAQHRGEYYMADPRVFLSEKNMFSELEFEMGLVFTSDEEGFLQLSNRIELPFEVSDERLTACALQHFNILKPEVEGTEFHGKWDYSCFISDYVGAGEFSFEYEVQVKDRVIKYRFFNFQHEKGESEFNSLGPVKSKWDDQIAEVFKEEEFRDLKSSMLSNVVYLVKKMREGVLLCSE